MKVLLSCAAALLAAVAMPGAQAADRSGASCGVTHHDCFPACVQKTPDGSDCAQTRNVCREVCGPKPTYPGDVQSADIDKLEIAPPSSDQPRTTYEEPATTDERRPMDEQPTVDTSPEPPAEH